MADAYNPWATDQNQVPNPEVGTGYSTAPTYDPWANRVQMVGQGSPSPYAQVNADMQRILGQRTLTGQSGRVQVTGQDGGGFSVDNDPNARPGGYDAQAFNVRNLDQKTAEAQRLRDYYANRTGPQDEFRQRQMALANQLQNQANGVGPSLAQMQLQQATDSNMAQAMALGGAQRGLGAGAGLRQIANQRASLQQGMAGQSAMARLQEQQAAQAQLAQISQGARAQDMQGQALNDNASQFYAKAGYDLDTQQMQARQAQEQLRNQWELGMRGLAINQQQATTQAIGAGASGVGALLGLAALA